MKERTFDEMISYFKREVSDMDIPQKNKTELLGMICAIGLQHTKELLGMIVRSALTPWISTKEALPDDEEYVLITTAYASFPFYASLPEVLIGRRYEDNAWYILGGCEDSYTDEHITAWAKLPEPYN